MTFLIVFDSNYGFENNVNALGDLKYLKDLKDCRYTNLLEVRLH